MKKLSFFLVSILCLCSCVEERYSSFTPGELWRDNNGVHINAHGGGVYFEKGTYYWFGEHKTESEEGNSAQVGVHLYSSKDLYNWQDEGIALHVAHTDTLSDISKGCILERPKVIFNKLTKQYVMYFHLELRNQGYNSARVGLAVSEKVKGPYRFVKSFRPNPGVLPQGEQDSLDVVYRDLSQGQMSRDMTLFVDDDDKAYHIYSSEENHTLHIAELSEDYQSYSGRYQRYFLGRFMEAPAVFKRNGYYYLIASACTGWAPNAARSCIAKSIWGPWTELGNPCRGDGDEVTFGGQSTYVLQVANSDQFIFMADIWRPQNAIDGRYLWLPIVFEQDTPTIHMRSNWSLH